MENLLKLDSGKCTACYACIKACPVKAIYINSQNIIPKIDLDRCIACGDCITTCSYKAIEAISDVEKVENMLPKNDVAAICDPAIAGEFKDITDYRKFVQMIRRLGFKYVCETSFGVDIIAEKQKNILSAHKGKHYITSHCPVMTLYTQKFQPELSGNLIPLSSPFASMACVVRRKYGENIRVVSISPCLGEKMINSQYKGITHIDAFLSFKDLRKMFLKYNIKEENVEFSNFDAPTGNLGALYPIPLGYIEACGDNSGLLSNDYITAQGRGDAIDAVNQFAKDSKTIDANVNVYFCEGCYMAQGCTKGEKFIREAFTKEYARKRVNSLDKKQWQQNIEIWGNYSEIMHIYPPDSKRLASPTSEKIEQAFNLLGKKGAARSTNCKSCGYETCLGLATAIAQGIASQNMCVLHAKQDSANYSNQLKVTTENLVTAQKKNDNLQAELNNTRTLYKESNEEIKSLLKYLYPAVAILDNDLKIRLSNAPFIDILGEDAKEIADIIPGLKGANIKTLLPESVYSQIEYVAQSGEDIVGKDVSLDDGRFVNISIFTLVPKKQIGIIIRNLFKGEDRPEEIISRLNEVIKSNLLDVQQIGFVLGEGAARTEKMLNSIIRSYKEQIGKK